MPNSTDLNKMEALRAYIETQPLLDSKILHLEFDDNTLVVFVDANIPIPFAKSLLQRHWKNQLEVLCATDLMVGSNTTSQQ